MIDDLDRALRRLLSREVADLNEEDVHFEVPDDAFAPALPAINLFLYDVRENRELRSNEWQIERRQGVVTKQRAPVRVDCSYLITAWAGDASSEHRLLGQVMQVLLRHSTLPEAVLQGRLQGQIPPLPVSVLQPGRLQSVGEFWQALGGKPKAALNYTVTIGVFAHAPEEIGPPVIDQRLRFRTGTEET
jgi:hypothetical protein